MITKNYTALLSSLLMLLAAILVIYFNAQKTVLVLGFSLLVVISLAIPQVIIEWRKKLVSTTISPIAYLCMLLVVFGISLGVIACLLYFLVGVREPIWVIVLTGSLGVPVIPVLVAVEWKRNKSDYVEFPGLAIMLLYLAFESWVMIIAFGLTFFVA